MKLYYLPGACSLSDHIVLMWTGLPHESIRVEREALRTSFLKINPYGGVPALVLEDGSLLTQNIAILDYLANLAPEAKLLGDGSARGRAEVLRWTSFINADVHKNFSNLFGASSFVDDLAAQENLCDKARERLRIQFETLNTLLEGKTWLVNDQRSIADPYLFVVLRWALKMKVNLEGLSNLSRFIAHMEADAGVKAALAIEA